MHVHAGSICILQDIVIIRKFLCGLAPICGFSLQTLKGGLLGPRDSENTSGEPILLAFAALLRRLSADTSCSRSTAANTSRIYKRKFTLK